MQRKLNLHSLALADLGNWEMVNCGVTGPEKKKLIWVHGRTNPNQSLPQVWVVWNLYLMEIASNSDHKWPRGQQPLGVVPCGTRYSLILFSASPGNS